MPIPSRRRAIALIIFLISATAVSAGYLRLRRYVALRLITVAHPPIVILRNRPVWMTAYLAETIANSARPDVASSPLDKQVLIDAYNALASNPWVKKVNAVRRVYGRAPGDTLEVDCVYRAPAALVESDNQYTLVAADRTVLPEQFSADDLPRIMYASDGGTSHTQLRIIQGAQGHPKEAGIPWPGEDLAGGLKVAELLANQPFTDDIVRIDVSNADGRKDPRQPQIVLITKTGSQIRWGHAPTSDDYTEASPAVKLAHLQEIYSQFHRLDANEPWVDLRFDRVLYPTEQASAITP